MIIGVPKESKNNEYRVGLTPDSIRTLVDEGHIVNVEHNAGHEIGFLNQDYIDAGANIIKTPSELYELSSFIVKVKEPTPEEYKYLNEKHTLFAYLHLAGDPINALKLVETGVTAIALETVTADDGSMPLLSPMSEIAGQLSFIVGSYFLLKPNKGMGTIIGDIDNIEPRIVTVIGGGVAGAEAIKKAIENKAHVKVLDLSKTKLELLKERFGSDNIEYIVSSEKEIESAIQQSDLIIGAVYVLGKKAPKVITKSMLKNMRPGSVMVDISIDQGGCFETSRPTTHSKPVFIENEIVHYCVTNMPGAVPLTATEALNNATLPYIRELANKGIENALLENIHLANGLNIKNFRIVHNSVKESF
ncbi:MAG: alanine dehydrogenase [Candidatus Neomarinimicrobiota bacterium]